MEGMVCFRIEINVIFQGNDKGGLYAMRIACCYA